MAQAVLSLSPVWRLARLRMLPRHYDQLFRFYRAQPCAVCHRAPAHPALCLVCAQLVCYKDTCCTKLGVAEAVRVGENADASLYMKIYFAAKADIRNYIILVQHGSRCFL